jgi:transcription elongation factor Elf1
MTQPSTDVPEPRGPQSIVSLKFGGYVVLEQLDTILECETCGRETSHQVLYLGQRIAEVRCGECGQCIGMDRESVVRAFVGEIVTQMMRLPQDVTRELKQGFSHAVSTLPRQAARLPLRLAQDALSLLRLAWNAQQRNETLEAIFNQVDTTLFCTACNAETAHRILYLGHRLAEACCAECGRAIGMSREEVFSDFVGEVVLHMLYLPPRVRRELRTDFSRAIQTLPKEMLRMPYHIAHDFIRLVRILRAPRRESEGPPSVGPGSE